MNPTSSVDVQRKASILEAIEALMHGRTTFMIAYRLITRKNCAMILVLEHGKRVEVRQMLREQFSVSAGY